MAINKNSFLLYCEMIHTVEKLPDELKGQLFMLILAYVNDQNPETDNLILQVAFEPIKRHLKRDLIKYEHICKRNKVNGKKGGRPIKPKKPSGFIDNPNEPKKADSDNDIDNGINKVSYEIHNTYIKDIEKGKDTDYAAWADGLYGMYGLKRGSLHKLLRIFYNHLKTIEKVHENIKDFKRHFSAWLGTQDNKQMLNEFKKRKVGGL